MNGVTVPGDEGDGHRIAVQRDAGLWGACISLGFCALAIALVSASRFESFWLEFLMMIVATIVALIITSFGLGTSWANSEHFLFGYQITATPRGLIVDTGHRTELLEWSAMSVTREVIPPFRSAMGVPRAYPVTGLGGEGVVLDRSRRLRRVGRWGDTAYGRGGTVFIPEAGSAKLDKGIAGQIWHFRPDLAEALGIARESDGDSNAASDPQGSARAIWVGAEPVPGGVVHDAFGSILVQTNGSRDVTVSGSRLPLVRATGTRKNVSLTVDGHAAATFGGRRGMVLTGYTSYLADTGENLLTLERSDAIRSGSVRLARGRDFTPVGVVIWSHRGSLGLSIRDGSDVTPTELAVGIALATLIGTRSFSPLDILNGM